MRRREFVGLLGGAAAARSDGGESAAADYTSRRVPVGTKTGHQSAARHLLPPGTQGSRLCRGPECDRRVIARRVADRPVEALNAPRGDQRWSEPARLDFEVRNFDSMSE
jgi:hypothetical protein